MLQPGEEGAFLIIIYFNFDVISDNEIEKIDCSEKTFVYNVLAKYKNFDINIKMKYKDLFHNQFMQNIKLSVNISAEFSKSKCGSYIANIYLKEIASPTKI